MGSYKTRKNKHLGKHRRSKKHLKSKHAKRSKKTKRVKRTKRTKLSRKYKGGIGKMFNAAVASVTGTDKEGEKGALAAEQMEQEQKHPTALTSSGVNHDQNLLHAVRQETSKKAEKRGMGPLKVTPLLRKAQSDLGLRASANSTLAMGPQLAASSAHEEAKAIAKADVEAKEKAKKKMVEDLQKHIEQEEAGNWNWGDIMHGGKKRRR